MPGAVVLQHGLLGWGQRVGARALRIDYFHRIAQHLRAAHGLRVLEPAVDGLGWPATRASQLLEQLHAWPARRRGERVTLIGHSLGGLDARWALSRLGGAEYVEQLITLGTPHRGTALCDDVALPVLARAPRALLRAAAQLRVPVDAATFLSRAHMAEWNASCADVDGVIYRSVGGARPRLREYWAPFVGTAALLRTLEGPNDGLVSTASAAWGTYLGTARCDHVDLINFPLKLAHRPPYAPLWDFLAGLVAGGGGGSGGGAAGGVAAGGAPPRLPPELTLAHAARHRSKQT